MKPSEGEAKYIARMGFNKKKNVEQEKRKKPAEEAIEKTEAAPLYAFSKMRNGINRD